MSASQAKNLEIGKIERSAEALWVYYHPISFPPIINSVTTSSG
jgi:hypothetical protein